MSEDLITVLMDDELDMIKAIFDSKKFHHLLVVDEKCTKVYGVLSDRDLLKALNPKVFSKVATHDELACLNIRVHQIMTRNPIVLDEDDDLSKAIALFNEFNLSCLPVLNSEGKPVGILSWRDIIKAMNAA
ncbi:CBS domain-containing protein [Marinomonas sp. PE14-40]|uniref:CBS domain-containing protein n=1 Tax=Marinomonas sp. PE14-40 TaxID=3060621 RepID=UPI003F66D3A5